MAGRRNYYFRQKVTEAELDAGFTGLEAADRALAVDNGIIGIVSGGSISQRAAGANLSVDVAAGVAYDKAGQRIAWGGTQNVSVATDYLGTTTTVAGVGNSKVISVFAKFKRNYSDPRTDGNSATVYFVEDESFEFVVRQGSETSGTPTAPSLDAEYILVCDIVRSYGQTTVVNANIVDHSTYAGALSKRREDAYVLTAGSYAVRLGQPEAAAQALLTHINDHVVDTTAAHAASAISYNGSGNWADATAVTSTTVEAAIDEVVSDLASTAGAARVGYDGSGAWADATTVASGSVNSGLDGIVSALAGTSGAAKVGYDGSGAWADATTVASGSVNSGLDGIVSALAGTSGAAKVGYDGSGAWADATTVASGSVNSGLDGIVSALGGSAGGGKVGFTSAQAWKDATTLASGSVTGAIAEVVADLAANAGAAKIGTAVGPTWQDGDTSYAAGSSVQSALDAIVNGLKGTTTGTSGAEHVGSRALSSFYSGTTAANPAGSIYAQLDKIITDLGKLDAGDSGGKRIACEAMNTWVDGTTNPAGSIVTVISKIINDLSDNDTSGSDGAARLGAKATGSFSQGSVRSQLDALDTGWAKLTRANTFSAAQTFNGAGGDDDPGLITAATPSSGSAYQFIWEISTNLSIKVRMYSAGNLTAGNIGLVFTINCAWSAAGGVWVPDGTSSDALKFLVTYNKWSVYRKQGTLPATWSDASWSGVYDMDLANISTTNTFAAGEWTGTAAQTCHVNLGGVAAGVDVARGSINFRRKFAAAPSSFSTTVSTSLNTNAAIVNFYDASVAGVSVSKTSSTAGTFFWSGTVSVS